MDNIVESFNFLINHSAFKQPDVKDEPGIWYFKRCFSINVEYVGDKTRFVMKCWKWGYPNINCESVGETFEEGIVKLAKRVREEWETE